MDILKCTHKRIKDMLRTYYEKIWKDMLVKTNKSLVYHENKTEFKEAEKWSFKSKIWKPKLSSFVIKKP